jgi:vancomycin permeability regulator SanA
VRIIFRIIGIGILVSVAFAATTFVQVFTFSHEHNTVRTQALIVMGTAEYNGVPSPVLAARLEEAETLYHEGIAPAIVLVGGREPGDVYTEATAGRAFLIAHGIPASAILAVPIGNDTFDSLRAAAEILIPDKVTHVTIVSDPFHLYRCVLIADRLGLFATAYGDNDPDIQGRLSLYYMARETLAIMAGRAIGFQSESTLRHGNRVG